ncbi:MAG: lysylphosphatidylglycerol synthase transmembrane domain-containing protein [Halanaerobium sp.]
MNEESKLEKYLNIKNSLLYFSVFLIISAAVLYYIYKLSAEGANLELIFTFSPNIIFSLLLLLFFYFIFDALRLFFVLKTLNADISFLTVYKLVFVNIFVSNITPMATGGGVAQVYFLQQKGVPLGKSSAGVVIRTLISASTLFSSVLVILFNNNALINLFPANTIFVYAAIFIILYVVFFYVLIFKVKFIMKIIYKILHFLNSKHLLSRKRFRRIVKYIFNHLKLFSKDLAYFIQGNKLYVFSSFLFTFIFLLAEFSFSYILLKGMGYDILLSRIISLQVIVTFVMYFAPTPGASGVAEGGFSILFANLVAKKDLFPLLFYWRFFTKYVGIFIGIITFFNLLIKGDAESEK